MRFPLGSPYSAPPVVRVPSVSPRPVASRGGAPLEAPGIPGVSRIGVGPRLVPESCITIEGCAPSGRNQREAETPRERGRAGFALRPSGSAQGVSPSARGLQRLAEPSASGEPLTRVCVRNLRSCAQRGVVSVEFLLAFMPVFLLFLGTTQLALVGAAHLIVQHAATIAARSAAVVIEDEPANYGGVARRDLSGGAARESGIGSLLGLGPAPERRSSLRAADSAQPWIPLPALGPSFGPQSGARMAAIREATYVPLLALAPSSSTHLGTAASSVAAALRGTDLGDAVAALEHSRAAAVITLHTTTAASDPPIPVFPQGELVTARVTYFYRCSVPLVSALICDTLDTMRASSTATRATSPLLRLRFAERADALAEESGRLARFVVLEGRASFPSQSAAYTSWEGE